MNDDYVGLFVLAAILASIVGAGVIALVWVLVQPLWDRMLGVLVDPLAADIARAMCWLDRKLRRG